VISGSFAVTSSELKSLFDGFTDALGPFQNTSNLGFDAIHESSERCVILDTLSMNIPMQDGS
jgi:hypothetical protein